MAKEKQKIEGIITSGLLKGITCKLIRSNKTGTKTVRLLEAYGPYEIGDLVCLGPGEFRPYHDLPKP